MRKIWVCLEKISHTLYKRVLRAYHNKVYPILKNKIPNRLKIQSGEIDIMRPSRCTGISGKAEELRAERTLTDFPGKSILSSAGTYQQYFHKSYNSMRRHFSPRSLIFANTAGS